MLAELVDHIIGIDPDRDWITAGQTLYASLNTDKAHGLLQGMKAISIGYACDYEAALATYGEIPDNETLHNNVSQLELAWSHLVAGVHLLLEVPTKTLEQLAQFENVSCQYEISGLQALAHLARRGWV